MGCNPTILAVHELYIRAFHILNDFPEIVTANDEEKYSQLLRELLDDHKDVVSDLALGFKECKRHIQVLLNGLHEETEKKKRVSTNYFEEFYFGVFLFAFLQDEKLVSAYLDRNLTSRLGIRMLATHHLHLKESKVIFRIALFYRAFFFLPLPVRHF